MKEFWDERFASEEYIYGTAPNEFYKSVIDKLPHTGEALFLAEGEGRNAVYAAKLGYDVTAVDYSTQGKEKAIDLARQLDVGINYIISSMEQFDFSRTKYDLIVLIYAHMPSQIRKPVHKYCSMALKPGGKIILEAFNKLQLKNSSGGPPVEDMLYSLQELKTDFEGLKFDIAEEKETELNEGAHHKGKADIVRIIATK